MGYEAIVVGGGVAGLTAAAYLARAGHSVLLLEKGDQVGGLVRTFRRNGIVYDGGIRAIEDSGIVRPMLRQLGLDVEFLPSPVALGVEDQILHVQDESCLVAYERMLSGLFPEEAQAIARILAGVRRVMDLMDVLYGIENPAMHDLAQDRAYLRDVLVPWLPRFLLGMARMSEFRVPVEDWLRRYTRNQGLIDVIAQHFMRGTPAFFALSYFSLYLDYAYPRGGTAQLVEALAGSITDRGGEIALDAEVVTVDPERRTVRTAAGDRHRYGALVWAADLNALYDAIDIDALTSPRQRRAVMRRRDELRATAGGDSVLSLFLGTRLEPDYFAQRASAHFFYTASRTGQSAAGPWPLGQPRAAIEGWLDAFLPLTTYEISCPALRDPALAPPGQTGLIISVLFDHDLVSEIEAQGWYEAFKECVAEGIVAVLDGSVFPGLAERVIDSTVSTPLTLERLTGNTGGAITGWAFTGAKMPAESRMMQVSRSVRTPLPGIWQAGQWTYSPSGLPIAILTGKLAADAAGKRLHKKSRS